MMEQDRKEKARVPAEVQALAVREKEKVAVKEVVGDRVVARGKEKVEVAAKGKAVQETSEPLSMSRDEHQVR